MSSGYQYARRRKRMTASVIREILKVSNRPNVISFAGGLPAPGSFPIPEFDRAMQTALKQDGARALQYTVTEGLPGLKEYLCGWLAKQGIDVAPEQMLFTHGSQQALDLLGKIFLNPGDRILVEDPTYLGAIQAFNVYEPRFETVPIDDQGMDPSVLAKKIQKDRLRFVYTVPTFQNPSGIVMSLERRQALIKAAAKRGIPIVEDDPYGLLRFKGEAVPSLYSLAKGKGVIYMSTFSKLLSPGIRLGFVVADRDVINELVLAKQASDLQTNTLIQYAVYHYCKNGDLERHIPSIIRDYARRAQVMVDALRAELPGNVTFVDPQGGMFVWCRLPEGMSAAAVFARAIEKGVAFVDGSVFYANGGGENTMRLNFTNSTDDAIRTGAQRLAEAIRETEAARPTRRRAGKRLAHTNQRS